MELFKKTMYKQVVRVNPSVKKTDLKKFKKLFDCTGRYPDGKVFDLRGYKEQPEELLNRPYNEVIGTSSEVRKQSRKLVRKYRVDNIDDWNRENWCKMKDNVKGSMWFNDYTLHVYSHDLIYPLLDKLCKEYNLEVFYSYVIETEEYAEHYCGFARIGEFLYFVEPSSNILERYAFAKVLQNGVPLNFERLEDLLLPDSEKERERYYIEHFIETNARQEIRTAFDESNLVCLANLMVNKDLTPKRTWNALKVIS